MDSNSPPSKILLPFANAGAKNTIPVASQIGITDGAASYTDGFPPLTRTPIPAGGVPPFGVDMNGVLFESTAIARWLCAGGLFEYDAAMSTQIGGYPKGSHLLSADETVVWLSTVENNTANPDTVGTGWVPAFAPGVFAQTGLTGGTVTPALSDAAKSRITLAGTLTSNSIIVLPNWLKDWTVVNNTTGAFTVTVKTAAGTGVVIPQNNAPTLITGNGTDIAQVAPNIAPGNSPTQAARINQLNSVYGSRGLRAGNNPGSPTSQFDVSADIVVLRNPTDGTLATRTATGTLTNNIAVAGPAANGRDQSGVFPASNYVHFYFIWNGTTLATLSSLAAPSVGPTLPSGYTHWAYIGCVILTAGSAITSVTQRGSWVRYNARQASLVGGSATTETAIAVATLVPPNALNFELSLVELAASANGSGTLDITLNIGVVAGSNMIGRHFGVAGVAAGTSQFTSPGSVVLPNVNQNYYYSSTLTSGTGPSTTHNVVGYEIPNGAM